MEQPPDRRNPLLLLSEPELEFVLRLVLVSGSLKDLASAYGVSYPTIRGRLDRLLERLRELQAGRPPDPMGELLARLAERGEITLGAAQSVKSLHRDVFQRFKESQP